MTNVERICKRNGTQDVLFYSYGIYGEQDDLNKKKGGGETSPPQKAVLKKYYMVR